MVASKPWYSGILEDLVALLRFLLCLPTVTEQSSLQSREQLDLSPTEEVWAAGWGTGRQVVAFGERVRSSSWAPTGALGSKAALAWVTVAPPAS